MRNPRARIRCTASSARRPTTAGTATRADATGACRTGVVVVVDEEEAEEDEDAEDEEEEEDAEGEVEGVVIGGVPPAARSGGGEGPFASGVALPKPPRVAIQAAAGRARSSASRRRTTTSVGVLAYPLPGGGARTPPCSVLRMLSSSDCTEGGTGST